MNNEGAEKIPQESESTIPQSNAIGFNDNTQSGADNKRSVEANRRSTQEPKRKTKRKRGRPRKKPEPEPEPIEIDFTDGLADIYINGLSLVIKRKIPEQPAEIKRNLSLCLSGCIDQYMPGSVKEHLPLIGLLSISMQIIKSAKPVIEERTEKNSKNEKPRISL